MTNQWIDRLARRLAHDETTRRGALRLGAGAGAVLAGLSGLALTPDEAAAACRPPGRKCKKKKTCCTGRCKRGKCKNCRGNTAYMGRQRRACWPWQTWDSEDRQFGHVAVDGDRVYVSDNAANDMRIRVFNQDGTSDGAIGEAGNGADRQIRIANGIAARGGRIYLSDRDDHKVKVYTDNGGFLAAWGSQGNGERQFQRPAGVAVDRDERVYVADEGNSRIQVFTAAGQPIRVISGPGTAPESLVTPRDVAVDDENGEVYVLDAGNGRIQVFNATGNPRRRWGRIGSGDGELQFPTALVVHDGRVYVTDSGNHRVQEFRTDGTFVRSWGSEGSGKGEFGTSRGIAADSSGQLFIGDQSNNRVVVVRPR